MATMSYTETVLGFICLFLIYHFIRDRNSLFIKWPVVGTLPGSLWNLHRLQDYVSKSLKRRRGTYVFKGPLFSNMDGLVTCDPMNINYILSKNFSNYTKGPDFKEICDPFGDGIFSADSDSWKFQRKMIHSYLGDSKFQLFLERTVQDKVANSLFPVLDRACIKNSEVDLEDLLLRLGFDIVCLLILGRDSKVLSTEVAQVRYDKMVTSAEEAVTYRYVLPEKCWKLLKWLQIGPEKKLTKCLKIFDDFVYQCIESKRRKTEVEEANFNFLTNYFMQEEKESFVPKSDLKFLRDVATNLVLAGRDTSSITLSWFFWMLATNQEIETKILQEIKDNLFQKEDGKQTHFLNSEELNKLVYLHATLCETLRLYPAVPINFRRSVLPDTLPSGHPVKENMRIFLSFYAMGRMEDIWGNDCCEFKPERWISEDGGIVHVPSYKFTAFNAGPRTCVGKDMGITQMKIIVVAIILNYRIQLVEGNPVIPSTSVLLHIKHGLKVRVTKREVFDSSRLMEQ